MLNSRRLACSFCGRGAADVAKLVAGPKVYICDECVALASRIIKGSEAGEPINQPIRGKFMDGLRVWLRRVLQHRATQYSAVRLCRDDAAEPVQHP